MMNNNDKTVPLEKLETGIPGFDSLADGGLPTQRTTLITGTAGSGKTIFAAQFLATGILKSGEPGVFVTFEESPDDIRRNLASLGWNTQQWERDNMWAFVDASPEPDVDSIVVGDYDLGGLLARIEGAVQRLGAQRLSVDSLGAILSVLQDQLIVRRELARIAAAFRRLHVTTVMTAERIDEYGAIARHGVEEFVADNVVILRNVLEVEKRRRTIEILKFRGTTHQKGEYPFIIEPREGIIVIPLSTIELQQRSSAVRISSGNAKLDEMCGGGFFRDSIVLVSGATGTGKTLTATKFIADGIANGERCIYFAFEESPEQLFRNAQAWGIDFAQMEQQDLLKVICKYPEVTGLEDHFVSMKSVIEEFQPKRVAIDSVSALERIASVRGYREFTLGLTSFLKHQEIATLLTTTTPSLMGGNSVTEAHISTITDSIILLRYVEVYGKMRRGIATLKMRGSWHDTDIREFSIDEGGMHIGEPFGAITGILSGYPVNVAPTELERLRSIDPRERSRR